MFSKELELSISLAYQEARERRHEYLTVEHMLLALLDNASALSILSACKVDIATLEKEIHKVLEDTVPLLSDEDSRDTSFRQSCLPPLVPSQSRNFLFTNGTVPITSDQGFSASGHLCGIAWRSEPSGFFATPDCRSVCHLTLAC